MLQKHKCASSQEGKESAQKFWKDEEKVVECIENCQGEQKFKVGKGVIFAVLRACLSCAQREVKDSPAPSKQIADVEYSTLRSENETLKASLVFERESGKILRAQLDLLTNKNKTLTSVIGSG